MYNVLCFFCFFAAYNNNRPLKAIFTSSSVKYVNLREIEPIVNTYNRYEIYIPQVGAKIMKDGKVEGCRKVVR